jgi:hypothetical protein
MRTKKIVCEKYQAVEKYKEFIPAYELSEIDSAISRSSFTS